MNHDLEHSHAPEAIAERIDQGTNHSYLSDFVYGAIDGTVTTFAVVSSVAGAGLDYGIVVVLGIANLVGDGFSMAAGNYLATRTNQQLRDKARAMEKRHIETVPEGEREEIRQIFARKGFTGEDLERAVEITTEREERWIDTMLVDELGISLDGPNPFRAAFTTFVAFCVVGMLPLLAFIFGLFAPITEGGMYFASTVITGIAFFLVGTTKSIFVEQRWYWSGLETLFVGGIAALLAYAVGMMLRGIVPA